MARAARTECAVHSASDRKANKLALFRLRGAQDPGHRASLLLQVTDVVISPC